MSKLKRINITLSEELNSSLDVMSARYGMSKAQLCTFVLGQWNDNMRQANDVLFGQTGALATSLASSLANSANANSQIDGQLKI